MKMEWKKLQYPKAQELLDQNIQIFLKNNSFAFELSNKLHQKTGTKFSDWIEYIIFPSLSSSWQKKIEKAGFSVYKEIEDCWRLNESSFPFLFIKENALEIAICVDSLEHFMMRNNISREIQGQIFSEIRKINIYNHPDYILTIKESKTIFPRLNPTEKSAENLVNFLQALELWKTRERKFTNTLEGLKQTLALAYRIVDMVGINCAAKIVLLAECEYWQNKTPIADLQKFLQDKLGMGWGNCDHYVFSSTRENFSALIQIFEVFGFYCTENFFYKEMGDTGVQILEHSYSKILILCEVHLRKNEVREDFAHNHLPPINKKNIIDLWVKENGESILEGGAKQIGINCSVSELESYMSCYQIPFSDITNSSVLHQKISSKNNYYGESSNHLNLVERNMGFKYFVF